MRRARRPVRMLLPKRERLYMQQGLQGLGLLSYRDYLHGAHWRALRSRLTGASCHCCGSERQLVLHHATYARLGRELESDLFTLCDSCHVAVHRASARTGNLVPPAGQAPVARRFTALSIGCPLCSARPGELCHTVTGMPREAEHKDRRRLADAAAKRRGLQRRKRVTKKKARSTGLTVKQVEAIRAAREAEFPLEDLRARTRLGR